MMNSSSSRQKKSRVERRLNWFIIWTFIADLCFCVFAAAYSTAWDFLFKTETDCYLFWDLNTSIWEKYWPLKFIQQLGAWLLIFTNFVPISLLVTVEMVKFL